jgi:RNA polymerase sigma-70 factor (ECF subfamily)
MSHPDSTDDSFDDLMGRLRRGDNAAAAKVFNEFANRLIDLVQKRLGPKIRRKVDPEDVLQSVFRSFFRRQATGQMEELETWDSLWGMLVVIAVRKCGHRVEYFRAACRDVQREVAEPGLPESSGLAGIVSDPEPTPAEEAVLNDLVQHLMGRLEGRHPQILALSLQGFTIPEISAQVGCTERTVYRVLERVKSWLQQLQHEEGPQRT